MRIWKITLGVMLGVLALAAMAFVALPSLAQTQATSTPGASDKPWRGFHHFRGHETLIDATASVTGLTRQEVMTELQSGKSLAQIAEGKGKTADEVIKAARTQLEDLLKQAVTDGRLTQAQADAKLQQFDQTASQVVNDTTLGQRLGRCHDQPAPATPASTGNGA